MAFWVLDSLKDPIFGKLVDGNLEYHQPFAKLFSVTTTLILVCLLEYLANARQQQELKEDNDESSDNHPPPSFSPNHNRDKGLSIKETATFEESGPWTRMSMDRQATTQTVDDTVTVSTFHYIGIPFIGLFLLLTYCLQRYELVEADLMEGFDGWYVLGYIIYAGIESFGSLAVATFWSYTNSTLSLEDAERFYGPIIAIAQLGAIAGSTLVATNKWLETDLLMVCALIIVLQILLMRAYDRRFEPTSILAQDDDGSIQTWQDDDVTRTKPFWSGVYLIIRNYYVLLILGVSCLYEVSLTCLDYQMKLLGWHRFEMTDHDDMNFSQFMGHYGQVVNLISLLFSSVAFPLLIRKLGLRITLRLFPTLLLLATIIAFGALPGNLTVLFLSMSILKAMTYSIHDPSKEILYIPTSNAVKFRAKFWIDVVGARISKAMGSGINTFAGNVDRSVKVGSIPSTLTAAALWMVCFYVGIEFDRLLKTGTIIGLEMDDELETYMKVSTHDDDSYNYDGHESPSEMNDSDDEEDRKVRGPADTAARSQSYQSPVRSSRSAAKRRPSKDVEMTVIRI